MATPRDAYVDSLRTSLEAMRHAREQLRVTEAACRRAIKAVEDGRDVGDVLDAISAASIRLELNEALRMLELTRHRARLAAFVVGHAEGYSLSAIGRKIGVSRQLASRYAEEART